MENAAGKEDYGDLQVTSPKMVRETCSKITVSQLFTSRVGISAIGPKPAFLFLERAERWRRVPIGCLTAQSHESL